jgi:hypothetical protein
MFDSIIKWFATIGCQGLDSIGALQFERQACTFSNDFYDFGVFVAIVAVAIVLSAIGAMNGRNNPAKKSEDQ